MQDIEFEPTNSFAYRFVRYIVLPEVDIEVAGMGTEKFLLREIAWPIIDQRLTQEQQAVRIPKAQSAGADSMSSMVRFDVNFLAKSLDRYESLGQGYFRAKIESDPEPSPQIWRANAIERSNVRASFICRRESLIVLFSAIHHRASEMIDSAFAAFFRLPNSM
jgi:hypothetical protein